MIRQWTQMVAKIFKHRFDIAKQM